MPDLDAFQLTAFAACGVFAIAWATLTTVTARFGERFLGRPYGRVVLCLAGAATIFWAMRAVLSLVPAPLLALSQAQPLGLSWLVAVYIVQDWALLGLAAAACHAGWLKGHPRMVPSRMWLTVNYLPALLITALAVSFPWVLPGTFPEQLTQYVGIQTLAVTVWFSVGVAQLRAGLRAGRSRPGFAANALRRRDFVVLIAGIAGSEVVVPLALALGNRWLWLAVSVGVGALLSLPWIARIAGMAVRSIALGAGMVLVMGGTPLGVHAATQPFAAAGLPRLADLLLVIALAAVALVARGWIEAIRDRLLLRRQFDLWGALEGVVRALPAEEGVHACCQRYLEAAALNGVDGVAIILADGFMAAAGSLSHEGLGPVVEQLWRSDPTCPALDADGPVPPDLSEALAAANVTVIEPLASARRRWGYVLSTTKAVVRTYSPGDEQPARDVAAQLALVLDTAALVERAVAVERSLAEAEKLAAIGETAARIVHEIRNPVTAARSLAQLLARRLDEPRGREQAALILGELERVERQVAALLRFTRREEFRVAPVELDRLARGILTTLGPRLADADVHVDLDAPAQVVTRGDIEKLRQVLVNLIENTVDAMAGQHAPRNLRVAVARHDGTARIRVTDTGGGIPQQTLTRVFEPLFSTKPSGTGLGLAIAKHLIDAHGGHITLGRAAVRGTVATVELSATEPTA